MMFCKLGGGNRFGCTLNTVDSNPLDGSFPDLHGVSHIHVLISTLLNTWRRSPCRYPGFSLCKDFSSYILCTKLSSYLGFPGFTALFHRLKKSVSAYFLPPEAVGLGDHVCQRLISSVLKALLYIFCPVF